IDLSYFLNKPCPSYVGTFENLRCSDTTAAAPREDKGVEIISKPRQGPATHALVIGVNDYPGLANLIPSGGLGNNGNLTSPVVSATHFANWLFSWENEYAPLGSISFLASGGKFRPTSGPEIAVPTPTWDAVRTAADAWLRHVDSDPDNIALFYFCG